MKPEDIHLNDIQRILIGNVPVSFFLEAAGRLSVVYLILMVSMRLIGKRMASQISRMERVAMVSLAAAIGIPILSPDRGILPAIIIAVIVVIIGRVISIGALKNQRFQKMVQGNIAALVEDGVMNFEVMEKTSITRERVLSQLRTNGIKNLGRVKRLYIEAGGGFTLIENDQEQAGLSTVPNWHTYLIGKQKEEKALPVCSNCGNKKNTTKTNQEKCGNCGENNWTVAVLD